jgi:hypothetical protein
VGLGVAAAGVRPDHVGQGGGVGAAVAALPSQGQGPRGGRPGGAHTQVGVGRGVGQQEPGSCRSLCLAEVRSRRTEGSPDVIDHPQRLGHSWSMVQRPPSATPLDLTAADPWPPPMVTVQALESRLGAQEDLTRRNEKRARSAEAQARAAQARADEADARAQVRGRAGPF